MSVPVSTNLNLNSSEHMNLQKNTNKKISVLLLDDEFEIFKKLTKVFENQEKFSVIGQASSCRIGTVMIQTYQPEIVIFNANMTSVASEEAPGIIRKMIAQSPNTRIVAIVRENSSNQIFRVLKAGASSCLSIDSIGEDLTTYLSQVLE